MSRQENTHHTQELERVKLEFIDAWESGKQPTVQDYITRYPEFAQDLGDFILTFTETERALKREPEVLQPSGLALRALERAREARRAVPAKSLTLQDLAKSAQVTMAGLAKTLGLPNRIMLAICRGQVLEPTPPIVRALSQAFQRTEAEIQSAFSILISPKAQVSGHFRAQSGHLEAPELPRMTFRQLIEESTELTADQKHFWLEEPDGKE